MRLALIALASVATVAHAQPYDDPETEQALCALDPSQPNCQKKPTSTDPVDPHKPDPPPPPPRKKSGHALRKGAITATLTVEASLSKSAAFEPTSLAPDVSYGVTDDLTVSVVHSGFATTGFRGSAGSGVCITGDSKGCAKVYNNAGVEALVDLVRSDVAISAVAGVHALSFDPLFLDAKLGAQTSYRSGVLTATFNPSVLVGVTKRGEMDGNNKGGVFLPVSIGAQVAKPVFLALGGGVAAPFADTAAWTARLGVIARYRVARTTFVAASFFLPKLAGGDSVMDTGADARTANLWLTYVR